MQQIYLEKCKKEIKMTEEQTPVEVKKVEVPQPPEKDKKVAEKSNILCLGLDCGTMNIVLSRSDNKEVKITRNVFLQLDREDVVGSLTDINYVESEDKQIFIIGEDAFKFANIFGQKVSRPMERGLISPKEINAIDVLSLIVKNLIGNIKDKEVYCSYSVPAEAIDEARSVIYHQKVFARILGGLGINHSPINEGAAIVYSECQKEKFSGVGISFGAGMCNVCVMFKGVEVLKFSTARSGDYIDKNVAESLDIVQNRVTSIKEKYTNLSEGISTLPDKKVRRVVEAIHDYYNSLISYTIKKIILEFNDKVDIEVDEGLPIIISGGTSLPQGFLELFAANLKKEEVPFKVTEVRRASNPMTAVSNGLLIRTIADMQTKTLKK
jgi:hypothetical protein